MRAVAHVGECTSDAIATPRGAPPLREVAGRYGFITTEAGEELYFHRNALHELDFDALQPGLSVEVEIERGTRGPQASRVFPVGERMAT